MPTKQLCAEAGKVGARIFHHIQESAYDDLYDYRRGSPHLTHRKLFDRLTTLLGDALRGPLGRGLPPTVLEVGAGDGAFTEPILAWGYQVTGTEVSKASLERLLDRFGLNASFRAVLDPKGSLLALGPDRYSSIVCVSVLHHIPDYLGFMQVAASGHLQVGGTFVTLQDPLWYPSLNAFTRRFSRIAFLTWRITKGNYVQGFGTLLRRMRAVYDDSEPGDVVEYHVVRQGVDQDAIRDLLIPLFERVEVVPY